MYRASALVLGLWFLAAVSSAQTTSGAIRGTVRDSITGQPLSSVKFACTNPATSTPCKASTDMNGTFGLVPLPPGIYRVHISADNYQSAEIDQLEVPVAGILEFDILLRPSSDVWERGQYRSVFLQGSRTILVFYGPDVDTSYSGTFEPPTTSAGRLDTSVSDVVPPQLISELPLQGRDVYTTLVMEPGVTSDSSTARGIAVSVSGQRPASSNFMLDGAENNNYLLSGPSITLPPEAIQEFRISTSNFSAEYGGTAGFIVNAVTRAGGNQWHGIGYLDFNRAGLNANDFQNNAQGQSRLPFYQMNYGAQAGGTWRNLFAVSGAFDYLQSKGDEPAQQMAFPSPSYVSQMAATEGQTYGIRLLEKYPAPAGATAPGGMYEIATLAPTATLHRILGLTRFDILPQAEKHHLMARLTGDRLSRPDLDWSPYPGFSAALKDRAAAGTVNLQSSLRPNLNNELRYSLNFDDFAIPRPHPEIPDLLVNSVSVALPSGSSPFFNPQFPQAGRLFGYNNRWFSNQVSEALSWSRGRQIAKIGAALLRRTIGGDLSLGKDGRLSFLNLPDFLHDSPDALVLGIDRLEYAEGIIQPPPFDQRFSNLQFSFFAQDSVRLNSRLSFNAGVRYEAFGAPANAGGTPVDVVQLGTGADLPSRVAGASVMRGTAHGSLYSPDYGNWAGRLGFSIALDRSARTVLRGGAGTFFDRSFDNLWENLALNNVLLQAGFLFFPGATPAALNYSLPLTTALAGAIPGGNNFNRLTMYQPGIRTPYVNTVFLGIQRHLASGITIETNYNGSLGRKLITTDRINRADSVTLPNGILTSLNAALPEILYRANQGASNYDAMTVMLTGSRPTATYQLAYTWSHSIDNQSDPLIGEFDDLSATNVSSGIASPSISAFARQFASSLDRGNSDFDQRHNLVGMGVWRLPWRLNAWRISALGAIRSGLPYTAYSNQGSPLYNPRANLLTAAGWSEHQAVSGGVRLLNPAAFENPPEGVLGNTGRNAFPGLGFYSVDASISRSFHPHGLPESNRITFRADAYNILNHANLNDPAAAIGPNFGVATYGRQTQAYGTPVLVPLQETSRQIHLMLRYEF